MPPTHEGKGLASLQGLAFGFPKRIRAQAQHPATARPALTAAGVSCSWGEWTLLQQTFTEQGRLRALARGGCPRSAQQRFGGDR